METLTVTEVAEILEVSEESVRRWVRENKLAADKKLGRAGHTIHLSALVDFVNRSSTVYLEKLKAWLKKEKIAFEVEDSGTGIPVVVGSPVFGPVIGGSEDIPGDALGAKISLQSFTEAAPGQPYEPAPDGESGEGETSPVKRYPAGFFELSQQTPAADPEAAWQEKIRIKRLEIDKLQKEIKKLELKLRIANDEIEIYRLEIDGIQNDD